MNDDQVAADERDSPASGSQPPTAPTDVFADVTLGDRLLVETYQAEDIVGDREDVRCVIGGRVVETNPIVPSITLAQPAGWRWEPDDGAVTAIDFHAESDTPADSRCEVTVTKDPAKEAFLVGCALDQQLAEPNRPALRPYGYVTGFDVTPTAADTAAGTDDPDDTPRLSAGQSTTITADEGEDLTVIVDDAPTRDGIRLDLCHLGAGHWQVTFPSGMDPDTPGIWAMSDWLVERLDLPDDPAEHAHIDGTDTDDVATVSEFAAATYDETERTWIVSIEKFP